MREQLTLLEEPPATGRRYPAEPIVRTAAICGELEQFRLSLVRAWGAGPAIFWAGLNPARADGEIDDMTVRRIIMFSHAWGFGRAVLGNVYPLRTPHPSRLRQWRKHWSGAGSDGLPMFRANADVCARLIGECDAHVAAWGASVPHPEDLHAWLAQVETSGLRPIRWLCLGTTESGAPKHPMARGRHRVPDDFNPVPFTPRRISP